MSKAWVISDTHFAHENIIEYATRPFSSSKEMDECLIDNWNSLIGEKDRVYHLGDVSIARRGLQLLKQLKGKKVLIKGNHDIYKLKDYIQYFEDIRAYKIYPERGIILSHIPVSDTQFARFDFNIHGHTHTYNLEDKRYLNVCVEQTNYKPLLIEEAFDRCKKQYYAIC